ncbi:hypothetical protein RJC70_16415 [Acinetobacter pittii]|nr:hypothetical protein [Acinetobacter pittii]MDR9713191.1 hypothetical protein [Acinetobacter pittii]
MRNILVTIFTLFLATSIYAAQESRNLLEQTQCEKAVELHGFLSRAQLDCNYHYYSEELKDAAAKCTKHDLGEKANSNMRCDSLKSLMIINKLSKFL